jgi:hypothetical protein
MLVGDIWRKPLIELTKSAKISCKAFSYGAFPDPFFDLRSPRMKQMKGIDDLQKWISGSNIVIPAGGRYVMKTSYLVG